MYHSDPNAYGRETASQSSIPVTYTYIPGRTPAQQAARDQANGQLLDAIVRALTWMWMFLPLACAAKAGFNWHELTGDKGAAVERSAQALVRWKWFQFILFINLLVMVPVSSGMPLVWYSVVAWFTLFWLVIYVRLAEFSLFRRGPIQWAMTPITRALDHVHTWAIIVAALLPLSLIVYFVITLPDPV